MEHMSLRGTLVKSITSRCETNFKNGFEFRLFKLKEQTSFCEHCNQSSTRTIQKGVDVALCTDMLGMAFKGECKTILITAGDRDFVPVMQHANSIWRSVYLSGYKNSMSHKIRKVTDRIFWLDQ
jgi:uncharacterized LabA/DUF88 family protein